MAVNSATPSVHYGKHWLTANTNPTTITNFLGGVPGKEIVIQVGDANTTFDFTASNLKGNGGADWATPAIGSSLRAVFDGTNWLCTISAAA